MSKCPFCGGPITMYQGYMDWTFFSCGDPKLSKIESGNCGAIISFRTDNSGGRRGSEALKAFEARA